MHFSQGESGRRRLIILLEELYLLQVLVVPVNTLLLFYHSGAAASLLQWWLHIFTLRLVLETLRVSPFLPVRVRVDRLKLRCAA